VDDAGEPPVAEVETLLPVEASDETAPRAEVEVVPFEPVERQAERHGRSAAANEATSRERSLAIVTKASHGTGNCDTSCRSGST